ncbi:MAG: DMT family transporter [Candidatus Methylomirabilales bacterium]
MTSLGLGILGGLGTGLIWAAISILARSLSGVIPPIGITAVRSVAGGALVFLLALLTGHGGEIVRMPLWVVLTLWTSMLIAMGFGDTCFFASMDHLGITRALILSMLNPLLTTLVGILLLGEPVTVPRAAGMFLVVAGLVLIVAGKGEAPERRRTSREGLRLIVLAAASWAASAILMKPALQVASVVAAAAIRIPAAGMVLWLTPWTRGTLRTLRKMGRSQQQRLAAICGLSALGALAFTTGIKYGGVAVGNVLAATAPLFTLPFELWVLRQPQSPRTILGAIVTVAGIGLMNL